jgi:hypothetical protein
MCLLSTIGDRSICFLLITNATSEGVRLLAVVLGVSSSDIDDWRSYP